MYSGAPSGVKNKGCVGHGGGPWQGGVRLGWPKEWWADLALLHRVQSLEKGREEGTGGEGDGGEGRGGEGKGGGEDGRW